MILWPKSPMFDERSECLFAQNCFFPLFSCQCLLTRLSFPPHVKWAEDNLQWFAFLIPTYFWCVFESSAFKWSHFWTPEIKVRQKIWYGSHVVKDSPQPHCPLELGLMKTNSDLFLKEFKKNNNALSKLLVPLEQLSCQLLHNVIGSSFWVQSWAQ
jgi:hypothetical protein